jgi:hypothetical protein
MPGNSGDQKRLRFANEATPSINGFLLLPVSWDVVKWLRGSLAVVCGVIGLYMALTVVFLWAPISFGWVFVDYPDPDRPGHLKCAFVSKPELLLKTSFALGLLWVAARLFKSLRQPNGGGNT